jgi:hypothetical protein
MIGRRERKLLKKWMDGGKACGRRPSYRTIGPFEKGIHSLSTSMSEKSKKI